eukprot:m.146441 g.146441  ORF g.146441 m.146441 type:complete len:213 (+) comp15034_c0_seq32:2359-2997(+)
MVTMESDSAVLWSSWTGTDETKPPEYTSYFFFNVTNAAAVVQGAKPALKMIGPFTYVEKSVKSNVQWDESRVRVNYTYLTQYYLLDQICTEPVVNTAELPACTLDDNAVITVGNAPLMGFIWQLMSHFHNATEIELDALGLAIEYIIEKINKNHPNPKEQEPFFITRPVKEILWGYNDTLLGDLGTLVDDLHRHFPKLTVNLCRVTSHCKRK